MDFFPIFQPFKLIIIIFFGWGKCDLKIEKNAKDEKELK